MQGKVQLFLLTYERKRKRRKIKTFLECLQQCKTLTKLKDKEYFGYSLFNPQKAVIAILRHSQILESFTYGEQQCTKMSHLKRSERQKQQLLVTMQPTLNLHQRREHLHLPETCSENSSPQPLRSRARGLDR